MIFVDTPIAGVLIVDLQRASDERGFFARSFCAQEFEARGLADVTSQCSVSFNRQRGTLRGLHLQAAPHEEAKLVRCTAGAIFDVVVDLRAQSADRYRWFGLELSAGNRRGLYIPKGVAHGFLSLEDASEVFYMISTPYVAEGARGVRWDDPSIAIRWPFEPAVISSRDRSFPLLDVARRWP